MCHFKFVDKLLTTVVDNHITTMTVREMCLQAAMYSQSMCMGEQHSVFRYRLLDPSRH